MPGWSGCDVCEPRPFEVRLTVYLPPSIDRSRWTEGLPLGEYDLTPVEHSDTWDEVHGGGPARVIVESIKTARGQLEKPRQR